MKVTLTATALKSAGAAAGVGGSTKKSKVKDPEELAAQTHKVSGLKPQAAMAAVKSLKNNPKEISPIRARR